MGRVARPSMVSKAVEEEAIGRESSGRTAQMRPPTARSSWAPATCLAPRWAPEPRLRQLAVSPPAWRPARLLNIDAAFEKCAILNGDACGRDVARQGSALAQIDSFGGMNVAVQPAVHDHVPGLDIGADAAIGADGQALPLSVIEPSTSPSTIRSSLPESSPLTTTDLPIVAISLPPQGITPHGFGRTRGRRRDRDRGRAGRTGLVRGCVFVFLPLPHVVRAPSGSRSAGQQALGMHLLGSFKPLRKRILNPKHSSKLFSQSTNSDDFPDNRTVAAALPVGLRVTAIPLRCSRIMAGFLTDSRLAQANYRPRDSGLL